MTATTELTQLTDQPAAATSLATRRGVLILLLLSLVQFMDILDASILNIALPSIKRDLGSASRACSGSSTATSSPTGASSSSAPGWRTCSAGGSFS